MRTFLLLLVLCVSGMAQELVGTNKGWAYYIIIPEKTGQTVNFIGIMSPYKDDVFIIDKNNFRLTMFDADCLTYQYSLKAYSYRVGDKVTKGIFNDNLYQAVKPQLIFNAIQKACRSSNDLYVKGIGLHYEYF